MRRPSGATEALGLRPLVQASGADASGVKSVPFMTAVAAPAVGLTRRPAAERAADWWTGGIAAFFFLKLAI